jgi:hypothetical protein
VKLNIVKLAEELQRNQEKIDRIRWWKHPEANMEGNLPGELSSF